MCVEKGLKSISVYNVLDSRSVRTKGGNDLTGLSKGQEMKWSEPVTLQRKDPERYIPPFYR
jgi:hypothetical protein